MPRGFYKDSQIASKVQGIITFDPRAQLEKKYFFMKEVHVYTLCPNFMNIRPNENLNFFSHRLYFLSTCKSLIHSIWICYEKITDHLIFRAIRAPS